MPLHLLKLCVGADSIRDMEDWIAERLEARRKAGEPAEQIHTTRMTPKRAGELLDGGSLFWVIKGFVAARQELMALRATVDAQGVPRCQLVLNPVLVPVSPRPYRAFQGWRYLHPKDAPDDLGSVGLGALGMPEAMRRDLAELGLL
jgi:hypothetical protein